jgi:hypothetical protein
MIRTTRLRARRLGRAWLFFGCGGLIMAAVIFSLTGEWRVSGPLLIFNGIIAAFGCLALALGR